MNTLSCIRKRIRALKSENSYPQLERMYPGVNRYFFWMLVNRDDYEPPKKICKLLGIRKTRPRHRRALPFAPGSAARAARIVERHAPSAEWLRQFIDELERME